MDSRALLPLVNVLAAQVPSLLSSSSANSTLPLPDPFVISQALDKVTRPQISNRNISELFTYWGEFISQDVSHIRRPTTGAPTDAANITLPAAAAAAVPVSVGAANASALPSFQFAVPDSNTASPPLPINAMTPFVDASHIYGTAASPSFVAGGKLPLNSAGLPLLNGDTNAANSFTVAVPGMDVSSLFSFALFNGNTNPTMQALFILFMREHNRYIDTLVAANERQDDATMFQLARQHVVALLQQIHYYEYLPLLLGENLLAQPAPAYSATVDPSIDVLYEAAAFRYGHMEVTSSQTLQTDAGTMVLPLLQCFYNSSAVLQNGIFPLFAGMSKSVQMQPMLYMVPELRNALLRNRPMDLFAIDIQRGRSFGLPSFNAARLAVGLPVIRDFASLTNDTAVAFALGQMYTSIDTLDVVVGGLAEATGTSSNLGPLYTKIIVDQFRRLRDGDPFWFETSGVLTAAHLDQIRHTSLRDVVARNVPEVLPEVVAARLPASLFQVIETRTVDPDANGYTFTNPYINGQYALSGIIESADSLRVRVVCASENWCGLGFGTDMTVADFVIGHVDPATQKIAVEARSTVGAWSTPVLANSQAALEIISTSYISKTITFEFRWQRTGNQPSFKDQQNIIMAMNPVAANGSWFQFHGGNREKLALSFVTGAGTVGDNVTQRRIMHGIGQAIVWLIVFPFGIVWGRYLRFISGWIIVHATAQSFGCVAVVFLLALPLTDPQSMGLTQNSPHSFIGIFLFAIMFIQLVLGVFNRRRLRSHAFKTQHVRTAHSILGFAMLLTGFANAGFGLKRLYPVGFTVTWPWLGYFGLLAFWMAVFAIAEIVRAYQAKSLNRIGVPVQVLKVDPEQKTAKLSSGVTPVVPALVRRPTAESVETSVVFYTWEQITAAVLDGEHLVVGNGRYVYNITRWLPSHPGGKIILETVNGTDITLDFFNESDYDGSLVSDAVAAAEREVKKLARLLPPSRGRAGSTGAIATVRQTSHSTVHVNHDDDNDEDDAAPILDLSAPHWAAIRKARWSHAHTKTAAQKLIGFMVGEITARKSHREFDRNELRRYAMLSKTCVSGPGAKCPTYVFKFALLYPFEGRRENEPSKFLPGQYVELVDRVSNKMIARSYTPISGSTASFEVAVKLYPTGTMSTVLQRAKPGSKQFRIRGPFGSPIINTSRALASTATLRLDNNRLSPLDKHFSTIICIVGGSGIVSALQVAREYLLPTGKTLNAHSGYEPAHDDELPIEVGDRIKVKSVGLDGWAIAANLETDEEGLCPLSILHPPAGRDSRVVIVNCASTLDDCAAFNILDAGALSFPNQLQIHHHVSAGAGPKCVVHGVPGTFHDGRLTPEDVEDLVTDAWDSDSDAVRKVVVCGPAGFVGLIFDTLVGLGLECGEIVILPPAENEPREIRVDA
ncbi:hypothetical protein HKX48_003561 [Thoreauomyces humboldtii]|nr:hypothetical protein HKX48_003561 [Thoreauomyces humboldtii]